MRTIYHVEIQEHSPFTDIHKNVKKGNKSNAFNKNKGDYHFNIDFVQVAESSKTFYFNYCGTILTIESQFIEKQNNKLYKGRAPPKFV